MPAPFLGATVRDNPSYYTPQGLMDLYDEVSKDPLYKSDKPWLQQYSDDVSTSYGDGSPVTSHTPVYNSFDTVDLDTDKDGVVDRKTFAPTGRAPDQYFGGYQATRDYTPINPETGKAYNAPTTPAAATSTVNPDQAKIDAYTKKVSDAYQGAFTYGKNKISQLGYDENNDPYGLYGGLQSELSRINQTIPDTVEGPQYYSEDTSFDIPGAYKGVPSYVDQYITDTRTKQRKGYERELTNKYGNDYGMTALPDTFDDDYINSLIEPQYADATRQLDKSRSRGLLDQTGYDNALGTLGKQKTAAISSLGNYGTNYLNTGRNALNTSFGLEKSRAGDWDFGDSFNSDEAGSRLSSEATRQGDLVKSQLATTAAGGNYFDAGSAIRGASRSPQYGGGLQGSGSGSDALMDQMGAQTLRRTRSTTGAF